MARVIAVIALLVVLASSKSLRGKMSYQQVPDTAVRYESGDQEMAVSQGDSSDFSLNQFLTEDDTREGASAHSNDLVDAEKDSDTTDDAADESSEDGNEEVSVNQEDSSHSSVHQVLMHDDGLESVSSSNDDSDNAEMTKSKDLAADDHFDSEETRDDADSFIQLGKESLKTRAKVSRRFKQDPDLSANDDEDEDSTVATAHSSSSSDAMPNELLSAEADGQNEAVQSDGIDATETEEDGDAAVSESPQELSAAQDDDDDDEQVAATSGGSSGLKPDDNEITDHLKSSAELAALKGDSRNQGAPMSVADSDTEDSNSESDHTETSASQSTPSDSFSEEHEGATEDKATQVMSTNSDDSSDDAPVQLKEDVASESEDASDDLSSAA